MRTEEVKIYKYDELPTDEAKEKAREWWKELEAQDFGGFNDIYEPAETAAYILGIEFNQKPVKTMGGETRYESDIRWSGFSSQGDGASFVGSYSYAKGCSRKIRAEFGTDERLHRIADALTDLQRKHGYKLTATITQSGHYSHEFTMSADVMKGDDYADAEVSDALLEIMRDFAKWIYRGLEAEYEWRLSDENTEESIRANEYEFYEDGEFAA